MKRRGPGFEAMRTALIALSLGALSALGASIARPAIAAAKSDSLNARLSLKDVFPPKPVSDLAALAGSQGQALLQWSAPPEDDLPFPKPDPVGKYLVRVATYPALALGGDTTGWFNAATPFNGPTPGNPGAPQALLTSLEGGTTYWFGMRSVDAVGNTSLDDDATRGLINQVLVPVKGVHGVTDLTAFTGPTPGEVDLAWSAPSRIGQHDPTTYDVRVSSAGEIRNDGDFAAAALLTSLSPSQPPAVGAPGARQAMSVTGLFPGTTYYFAVRGEDSGSPQFVGLWQQGAAGRNPFNFAPALFVPGQPNVVTNLTALHGATVGTIGLAWTAPANPNAVPLSNYVIKMSTLSVAAFGGDTTSWFLQPGATTFAPPVTRAPGGTETYTLTGLGQQLATVFYFGLKTVDALGETSFIDLGSSSPLTQAQSRPTPIPSIANLTAVAVSTQSGRVDLYWTAPDATGALPPLSYQVRASTAGQIANDSDFAAAQPLSAFSSSPVPAVSSGTASYMTVTGLVPLTTYYFAIRVADGNVPPVVNDWFRSVASSQNVDNFAVAPLVAGAPDSVTDLTALTGSGEGAVALAWTAPRNQNFAPVTGYEVRFATFSVQDLAGNATAWYLAASSGAVELSTPAAPGSRLTLSLTGLVDAAQYFVAVKSTDALGEASAPDAEALGVAAQARARARGVGGVTDLTALTGAGEGAVNLVWTAPYRAADLPPESWRVVVSTLGQIADDAGFAAARPLSAFSTTPAPAVSTGGARQALTVTGLAPFTTYYFALRVEDSSSPVADVGHWVSDAARNAHDFAVPSFFANAPDAVTNLSALPGAAEGSAALAWTAPRNQNNMPVTGYEVRFATFSVQDLAGDATAWYLAASSGAVELSTPAAPGSTVTLTVAGLVDAAPYYFAVKSTDTLGEVSPVDLGAAGGAGQAFARARGVGGVTDLTAMTDSGEGAIDLVWTAPYRSVDLPPEAYRVVVSTVGQIADDAGFAAARPLSAFSLTPPPAVSTGGARQALTVTGLAPFTTYYFALRVEDSSAPLADAGHWVSDAGRNFRNFAVPSFFANRPNPVTDLTTLPGPAEGDITLQWTVPSNPDFVPISSYTLRAATFSAASLGGGTTWFNVASLSYVYYPASGAGGRESLTLSGLAPGAEYFFGLRAFDAVGEAGQLDAGLVATPLSQVTGRPRGVGAVTDLTALPGAGAGVVALSWTTPFRVLPVLPEQYDVRMSTAGEIASDADFAAAAPLAVFSPSAPPSPGLGAARQAFNVTGLAPFTTYYFAVRVEDSSAPVVNAGTWLRDTHLGLNVDNVAVPSFFANPPQPVTDLSALPGSPLEGDVALSWTAPLNQNLMPIARYEVRYATFPVTALASNATSWLALASSQAYAPARAPGAREGVTVHGLYPDSTFYFAVRSFDVVGEESFADLRADPSARLVQASAKPLNLPPGTPAGLTALDGLKRALLSWNDLPAGLTGAGKGLDFAFYRLERSTDDISFVAVTTQTALALTDRPLRAETTYYYRLVARDSGGLESAPSPAVAALPFTLAPQEPFGLQFSRTASSITLSWSPTTRFETTEPFYDPAHPASDELSGYQIWRATDSCVGFSSETAYGLGVTSHTEADNGVAYYYKVMAVNDFKASTGAVVLSPFGDQLYTLPDCVSEVVVSGPLGQTLLGANNPTGQDIFIRRQYDTSQNGGDVLQTARFTPLAGGGTPVKNFAFSKPVTVALHYQVDSQGRPVPASVKMVEAEAAARAAGARPAAGGARVSAASNAQDLSLYWNNGQDYKKLYGAVDTNAQTVTAQTPNIGSFQVRRLFRDSGTTFDISNITTRVITPNGDGLNDVMLMLFDNPNHAAVSGKIFDLRGAYVADMAPGPQPDSLQWDGKMRGKPVTSGVYIYQVSGDGKIFNGTCVVAR